MYRDSQRSARFRKMKEIGMQISGDITWYYVRLGVPEVGFGANLDKMIQFYWERGEALNTVCSTKRTDQFDGIYFYFRRHKNAEDFAKLFTGERNLQ